MYEIFENLLKERGLRPADVSKATGIRSGVFSDWKAGRGQPKIDKMFLIAKCLNVPLEFLLTGEMPDSFFNDQEISIISAFRKLNHYGQEHFLEYLANLTELEKYQAKNESSSRSAG